MGRWARQERALTSSRAGAACQDRSWQALGKQRPNYDNAPPALGAQRPRHDKAPPVRNLLGSVLAGAGRAETET